MEMQNSPVCGEMGQRIVIKDEVYFIGDVVKLTHTKHMVSSYFQIIFSSELYKVFLHNPTNCISGPAESKNREFYGQGFIELCKITEGHYSHVKIERIGNEKKHLNLIKRIRRNNLKPIK